MCPNVRPTFMELPFCFVFLMTHLVLNYTGNTKQTIDGQFIVSLSCPWFLSLPNKKLWSLWPWKKTRTTYNALFFFSSLATPSHSGQLPPLEPSSDLHGCLVTPSYFWPMQKLIMTIMLTVEKKTSVLIVKRWSKTSVFLSLQKAKSCSESEWHLVGKCARHNLMLFNDSQNSKSFQGGLDLNWMDLIFFPFFDILTFTIEMEGTKFTELTNYSILRSFWLHSDFKIKFLANTIVSWWQILHEICYNIITVPATILRHFMLKASDTSVHAEANTHSTDWL